MKKLWLLCLLAGPMWAEDIYISSPYEKQLITGVFTLQVMEPMGNPASIRALMIHDVNNGPDRTVWSGALTAKNNYTLEIDPKSFPAGEYDIKVSYIFQGRVFDEDVEVYVQ